MKDIANLLRRAATELSITVTWCDPLPLVAELEAAAAEMGKATSAQQDAQYYQDVLEQGFQLVCDASGCETEHYDTDQADGECYLDAFRDAAKIIRNSGIRWDGDECEFLAAELDKAEPVAWMNPHTGESIYGERLLQLREHQGKPGKLLAVTFTVPLYRHPPSAGVPDGWVRGRYDHRILAIAIDEAVKVLKDGTIVISVTVFEDAMLSAAPQQGGGA